MLGWLLGAVGVLALMLSTRYEVTVTLLALYLGLLDGPVKLLSASQAASGVRDVLIAAVALGTIVRLLARRERVTLPPLSGWVLAFVALVLVEAFNPQHAAGLLKILGGFRQQLEWVPFFFFGYLLMRSQAALPPAVPAPRRDRAGQRRGRRLPDAAQPGAAGQLGPGYSELRQYGNETGSRRARTQRRRRARAPAGARLRRRLRRRHRRARAARPAGAARDRTAATTMARGAAAALGALLAVATRPGATLQVVGAVIALLAFAAAVAQRRVDGSRRPLAALLAVAVARGGRSAWRWSRPRAAAVFSRYASIAPSNVGANTRRRYKERSLSADPQRHRATRPSASASARRARPRASAGTIKVKLEGHGVSAETQYNFVVDELGLPGLLAVGRLSLSVICARPSPRLRRVGDLELRIYLAARVRAVHRADLSWASTGR